MRGAKTRGKFKPRISRMTTLRGVLACRKVSPPADKEKETEGMDNYGTLVHIVPCSTSRIDVEHEPNDGKCPGHTRRKLAKGAKKKNSISCLSEPRLTWQEEISTFRPINHKEAATLSVVAEAWRIRCSFREAECLFCCANVTGNEILGLRTNGNVKDRDKASCEYA